MSWLGDVELCLWWKAGVHGWVVEHSLKICSSVYLCLCLGKTSTLEDFFAFQHMTAQSILGVVLWDENIHQECCFHHFQLPCTPCLREHILMKWLFYFEPHILRSGCCAEVCSQSELKRRFESYCTAMDWMFWSSGLQGLSIGCCAKDYSQLVLQRSFRCTDTVWEGTGAAEKTWMFCAAYTQQGCRSWSCHVCFADHIGWLWRSWLLTAGNASGKEILIAKVVFSKLPGCMQCQYSMGVVLWEVRSNRAAVFHLVQPIYIQCCRDDALRKTPNCLGSSQSSLGCWAEVY